MAIEFTNKPVKWENEGAEPSAELKKNGFQAGYKPPAGIFNHHWHETAECIEELQTKVSDMDDNKVETSDVLKKTNTTAFTPTGDYQPATKKYVDDNKAQIADNLTTEDSGKGLSAKQGKILNDNKVDKVTGKGLSANDFTDGYKTKLDNLDTSLSGKVDKVTGKGLSANDFTDTYKTKLDNLDTSLAEKAPSYSYGTADLTAGTSALATGKLYFVYE